MSSQMTEHPLASPAANHCAWCEYWGAVQTTPLDLLGLECNGGFTRAGKGKHSLNIPCRQGICSVSRRDLLSPLWLHPAQGTCAFPAHTVRVQSQELIIVGCTLSKRDA